MTELFVPKKNRKKPEDLLNLVEPHLDEVMVFASKRNIFALPSRHKDPVWLKSRPNDVLSLCWNDGKLYDGGLYDGIYETLTDDCVANRGGAVYDICSQNNKLYDSNQEGAIFETKGNYLVARRPGAVFTICSHDGFLYDAGNYKGIFETFSFSDDPVFETEQRTRKLFSHDDVLYRSILCDGLIYNLDSGKCVGDRYPNWVLGMGSFDGGLYDVGTDGGMFNTFLNKEVYRYARDIYDVVGVPREFLEDYL